MPHLPFVWEILDTMLHAGLCTSGSCCLFKDSLAALWPVCPYSYYTSFLLKLAFQNGGNARTDVTTAYEGLATHALQEHNCINVSSPNIVFQSSASKLARICDGDWLPRSRACPHLYTLQLLTELKALKHLQHVQASLSIMPLHLASGWHILMLSCKQISNDISVQYGALLSSKMKYA